MTIPTKYFEKKRVAKIVDPLKIADVETAIKFKAVYWNKFMRMDATAGKIKMVFEYDWASYLFETLENQ